METRKRKLGVAFIWHMHQPYYKDPVAGKYLMPWVRLHGVKDYYPMAKLVERFDGMRAVFNLVPVLVEQINDYAKSGARDTSLDLTIRKASSLEFEEKLRILAGFFAVNFKRFIEPNARYTELLIKRGVSADTVQALKKSAKGFTDRDFLDLQVLFNLAWFHSISLDEDANLRYIAQKGSGYTEEDKEYIVAAQGQIMGRIIPLYKRLQDEGRIEITTSPYYHPILPLLCDTQAAKVSSPKMKLPGVRFAYPEDADWQIREAVRYHTEQFGRKPAGMWPSEGSVSDEALHIIASNGIKWVATDEDILFKSLPLYDRKYRRIGLLDRRLIYQPYRFKKGARNGLSIIFRDKNLSDLISFNYSAWDGPSAAEDLLGHFRRIAENLRRDSDRGLAAIVMDGENAWEYYHDNGRQFFETLYARLEGDPFLQATTVSEFLAAEEPRKSVSGVYPGSWIDHNFDVWIGDEQDNLSWEYLYRTRQDLVKFSGQAGRGAKESAEAISKAWRELYIAEGSDWNWWYSGPARSGKVNPFDPLYLMHLKNVYTFLGRPVPEYLNISIA